MVKVILFLESLDRLHNEHTKSPQRSECCVFPKSRQFLLMKFYVREGSPEKTPINYQLRNKKLKKSLDDLTSSLKEGCKSHFYIILRNFELSEQRKRRCFQTSPFGPKFVAFLVNLLLRRMRSLVQILFKGAEICYNIFGCSNYFIFPFFFKDFSQLEESI